MKWQVFYFLRCKLYCMQEEIERALSEIDIGTKSHKRRLKKGIVKWGIVFFSLLILAVVFCTSSPTFLSGLIQAFALLMLLPTFLFMSYVYYYVRPYNAEEKAFMTIANAAEMLAKSKQPMAYNEAYQCLEQAYQTLNKINLSELVWYSRTNSAFKRFLENLELTILPATTKAIVKVQHLEEIALAVYSQDPSKIEAVNEILESEPSYKREEKPPRKQGISLKALLESRIGKVLVSLCLGYGLVLMICLFYVLMTHQDLMVFARERPDIIILGGLIASGITFWKTKSRD